MDVKAPSRIVLAVNMVPAKKLLSVFTFQTKTLSELLKAKERITLDLNYLQLKKVWQSNAKCDCKLFLHFFKHLY